MYFRTLIILALWFATLLTVMPLRGADSVGSDFVLAFQRNLSQEPQGVSLFVAAPQGAAGAVKVPEVGFERQLTIPSAGLTEVKLPLGVRNLPENAISQLSVQAQFDRPVTVYGLNRTRYSTDAWLALPVDALGVRYRVLAYSSKDGGSQVAIVATRDGTRVQIHPAGSVAGVASDGRLDVRLDRGQVYSLVGARPTVDLTGTRIESSAPVAVLAGALCAYVPPDTASCDHLEEMLPPLSAWGRRALTLPLATRRRGDLIRVLADRPDTHVKIDGTEAAVLQPGQVFEQVRTTPTVIEADGPILVGQYSVGTAYDGVVSDPFFVLVPPSEQFLDQYVFATPETGFRTNFVNLVSPTGSLAALRLDGSPIDQSHFSPIGTSGMSGAALPLTAGVHRLTGNRPFGITVYGFDQADSYGYPGGMAFAAINPTGDAFPPAVAALEGPAGQVRLRATDSEDANADGRLDPGEDLDGDGQAGPRTEDHNHNDQNDPGEDRNGNGLLDRDTGLASVTLAPEAMNLRLESGELRPGAPEHRFAVAPVDPARAAHGAVIVADLAGNRTRFEVRIDPAATASFADQAPLILGELTRHDERSADLLPRLSQHQGRPTIELTTDFAVRGAVLELDAGGGWQRLGPQALAIPLDPDGRPWSLRVRTGGCLAAVAPDRYRIRLSTRTADGTTSRSEIPIGLRLAATPWWVCLLPYLIAAALAAALAALIYGFVRPSRFPPQLGVILDREEDLNEGWFLLLRAQRGTRAGFYRDARAYVREDYRVCGTPASAVARLRADRGRVMIQPMRGSQVLWSDATGVWQALPPHETGAAVGTLYRNERGSLYFMLRNR